MGRVSTRAISHQRDESLDGLAHVLRVFMKENAITQIELGELIGVSQGTVQSWCANASRPTKRSWKKILEVIGEPARKEMLRI